MREADGPRRGVEGEHELGAAEARAPPPAHADGDRPVVGLGDGVASFVEEARSGRGRDVSVVHLVVPWALADHEASVPERRRDPLEDGLDDRCPPFDPPPVGREGAVLDCAPGLARQRLAARDELGDRRLL